MTIFDRTALYKRVLNNKFILVSVFISLYRYKKYGTLLYSADFFLQKLTDCHESSQQFLFKKITNQVIRDSMLTL